MKLLLFRDVITAKTTRISALLFCLCFINLCITVSFSASAQDHPPYNVALDIPLIDVPFNAIDGGSYPSMEQSLAVSKSFYQMSHLGLGLLFDSDKDGYPNFWGKLTIAGFDALVMSLPPSNAWLHEEWHRAVMTNRHISSHNGLYDHHGNLIPVNHVADADLIRLKRDHPAEQVRLSAAGMEAEHQLALALEKDLFFRETRTWDYAQLWLLHLGPSSYLSTCNSEEGDKSTDEMNTKEGTDVSERDFTGLDCVAWVYDLHRPNEPYEARGAHPSGIGINRYRKLADLTSDEKKYLRLQQSLSYLNFADPFLLGWKGFKIGEDKDEGLWNATLRHQLTSFGYAIDVNFFIKRQQSGVLFILHNYFNKNTYYPGIEAQTMPLPWNVAGLPLAITPRLAIWQQPREQLFHTVKGSLGALGSLRWQYTRVKTLQPFLELETKSPGWVAGNVNLRQGHALRVGIVSELF